jgi:hypothetical protein
MLDLILGHTPDALAILLEETGDYRVLRRLKPRVPDGVFAANPAGSATRTASARLRPGTLRDILAILRTIRRSGSERSKFHESYSFALPRR